AQFGPFHADLANTLNNLGVIYERANSPAEAELCYRRAYAIATKALEPGHPFVATSRKNLEDFCRARGRPFDRSAIAPEREPLRKRGPRPRRLMVSGAVGALVLAMLVSAAVWFLSAEGGAPPTTSGEEPSPHPKPPLPGDAPAQPVPGESHSS